MKITFYGTAPGVPVLHKRHSCVRVSTDKLNCILDCGEGATQAFLEYNDDVTTLDFVYITHWHPDHAGGIFMLLQMMAIKKRTKTLQLFIPENKTDFHKILEMFYLFRQNLPFQVDLLYCDEVNNFFPELTHFYTDHLYGNTETAAVYHLKNECLSFGIKIKEKEKTVVYTSDLISFEYIKEYLIGCDICITDGIHPLVPDFIELSKMVKDKIYLTHGLREGVEGVVKNDSKFRIVDDGETVIINGM